MACQWEQERLNRWLDAVWPTDLRIGSWKDCGAKPLNNTPNTGQLTDN